jgi:hypothetical protein
VVSMKMAPSRLTRPSSLSCGDFSVGGRIWVFKPRAVCGRGFLFAFNAGRTRFEQVPSNVRMVRVVGWPD